MKKIALTSVITICVACPAFAEPSHTSATFPNDEYMLEDYTYTGQATYTNMGVYDGSVNANAEYDWDIITVNPGYYIPQSSTTAAQCTAGSFCPGIATDNQAQTPHYDSTAAQGITSCSTLESGAYPNSAVGASANTDCYRACTVANANIAHATAVSGNDYYGAGTDTCSATSCESGWHVQAGAVDLVETYGVVDDGGGYEYVHFDGEIVDGHDEYTTWSGPSGLTSSDTGKFVVDFYYDEGRVTGRAACSTQAGSVPGNSFGNYAGDITKTATITNEAGQTGAEYCWCRLDSYTPYGGSTQNLNALWVYYGDFSEDEYESCESNCVAYCNNEVRDRESPMRQALLSYSIQAGPASCAANTITINWSGASQADIDANEAGSTVYGGDIRTPVAATPVTGKTFKGWKFQKPGQGGN